MWWVRFELLVPGLGFMGTGKAVSGLALVDLSPNEAQALREAGQEDHPVPTERAVLGRPEEQAALRRHLGYWPPVLRLREIRSFLYRLSGPGERALLREPVPLEPVEEA